MKNHRHTLTEMRFNQFIKEIKESKSDQEIAMCGWHLLEMYRAFRYEHRSLSTEDIIKRTYRNTPQCDECKVLTLEWLNRARWALACQEGDSIHEDSSSYDIAELLHDGVNAWKTATEGEVLESLEGMFNNETSAEEVTTEQYLTWIVALEKQEGIDPPVPDNAIKEGADGNTGTGS